MKYRFEGKLTVGLRVEIEAESEEVAADLANGIYAHQVYSLDESAGLHDVADGVGLRLPQEADTAVVHFITADCWPEWDSVKEVKD